MGLPDKSETVIYSNVRKPSKNTCDFWGDSKVVSQKMQYMKCRMNWIFRTHNGKFQRPPSITANDFHSFWYEEKHPWHSLEDPENWPFSSSLTLSHTLPLSKLQLKETWVLIHTCTHTHPKQRVFAQVLSFSWKTYFRSGYSSFRSQLHCHFPAHIRGDGLHEYSLYLVALITGAIWNCMFLCVIIWLTPLSSTGMQILWRQGPYPFVLMTKFPGANKASQSTFVQ